jgi:hypothetical protein
MCDLVAPVGSLRHAVAARADSIDVAALGQRRFFCIGRELRRDLRDLDWLDLGLADERLGDLANRCLAKQVENDGSVRELDTVARAPVRLGIRGMRAALDRLFDGPSRRVHHRRGNRLAKMEISVFEQRAPVLLGDHSTTRRANGS